MTVIPGVAVGRSALALDDTQPDLFAAAQVEVDLGIGTWGAEIPADDEAVTLQGSDAAPGTVSEAHGSGRLLGSEAFTTLAALDRSSARLDRPTLLLEVRLAEAGHTLTVASALEREIRRLESVTADMPRGIPDEVLATALADGRPAPAGPGGLRISRATGSDAALTLVLEPTDTTRSPLARWPRLALALAASAVADLGFTIHDSAGARFAVDLARPRHRVVAGGLPDRAVTLVLTGRQGGFTRQVTAVTTGEPRVPRVDPSVN